MLNITEYNKCVRTLAKDSTGMSQKEYMESKFACLNLFYHEGHPTWIPVLFLSLKDESGLIRERTAEVIVHLFDMLKSRNMLYPCLRYISIAPGDITYFKEKFSEEIAVKLLAISSMNGNGYVREAAIDALASTRHALAIHYIIFRLSDWVVPVREAAMRAIKHYFVSSYKEIFIQELESIENMKSVQRIDLSPQLKSIVEFITSDTLTDEYYRSLSVSLKARFLYVKCYISNRNLDKALAMILLQDKNFMVRLEIVKYLSTLEPSDQTYFRERLLSDTSSHVRLRTLQSMVKNIFAYEDVMHSLISDESASVRDFCRFYLKRIKEYDFGAIYEQRIKSNDRIFGSILGLTEVTSVNNLPLIEHLIQRNESVTKVACLIAMQNLNLETARKYALQLITHPVKRIRRKCIEILASSWDDEVRAKCRNLLMNGQVEERKTVLKLYNRVGGWDAIDPFIRALSDDSAEVQDLSWILLKGWKDKAFKLFTTPSETTLQEARATYSHTIESKIGLTPYRERLWKEVKLFLK